MPVSSLSNRVARFQQNDYPPRKTLFKKLAQGQDPEILFITCSDSRVNPHLITQSEPGDLFVGRNAGNIIPPYSTPSGEAGTIEYALEVLNISEIIVCGHTHCGAMHGLLKPESLTSLPAVSAWIQNAAQSKQAVDLKMTSLPPSSPWKLLAVIKANVLEQIEHLKTHPAVAKRLNQLIIHGWVYQIGSGKVLAYQDGYFLPLGLQKITLEEAILEEVILEEAMYYLADKSQPQTAAEYNEIVSLLSQVERKGIIAIWNEIKSKVADRIFKEIGNVLDPKYSDNLQTRELEQSLSFKLKNISHLQQNLRASPGYLAFCSQTLRHASFFAQPELPLIRGPEVTQTIIQSLK